MVFEKINTSLGIACVVFNFTSCLVLERLVLQP